MGRTRFRRKIEGRSKTNTGLPYFSYDEACPQSFKTTLTASTPFIAPLSWSPPTQLPRLPFTGIFNPPKTAIPSMEIEHLGQQLNCITYFDELVEIMINDPFGPTMLSHCLPEKKKFRYSSNTGLWVDSVTRIKHDLTFTFDNPL